MAVPQEPIDTLARFAVLSDNNGRLLSTALNADGTSSLVAQALSPVGMATNAQTVFLAGSGNQALSVAGNFRIAVVNPANSGKTLHIFKFDSYATASGMGELYVGTPLAALTGVPTAARRINNVSFGSSVASVAQVYADTNTTTALGGGVDSGIAIGVAVNLVVSYLTDLPEMQVPPGFALGINVPFAGAANASANLFWYEQ